jgi:autotransporter-associated beta strand protein
MKRFILSISAALAVAFSSAIAPAVTHTWQGASPFMATNTNWVGNITPTSGDTALTLIFPGGFVTPFQDIATPLVVQEMQWGNYNTSGAPIKMDNLGANPSITQLGNFTIINNDINFADPTTITGANSLMQLYGQLSGGNLTFNSSSGTASFSMLGSGANSLGGVNTVNANVNLDLQAPNAMGGTLNIVGGAVFVQGAGTLDPTIDVNISAGGGMQLVPSTTMDDVDVSGGSIILNFGQQLTINGNISSSTGVSNITTGGMMVALSGPTTVNVTSGGTDFLQIGGQVTTGSITKIGSGTLVLGNPGNTFSGTNTVTAGILRGTAESIGTSVTNNATVELYTGTFTSPALSGPGTVVIDGFAVVYNVAQPYTGPTLVRSGIIQGDSATLPSGITGVGTGGSVLFDQGFNGTYTGTLSGPLAVSKFNNGILTLGGNNPYPNGTAVFGGGLTITSDTAIGTGLLNVGSSNTILEAVGNRTLANQLLIGQGATFIGTGDFNFTDTTPKLLSGSITHNSVGSTIIDGKFDVQPSGLLTVNQGLLALGDPAMVNGFTSAGPVVVNGGQLTVRSLNFVTIPTVTLATGTLDAPNGYAIPLGAVLQGTGNVTGRVATANGSTIIATGAMGIGDPFHPAGVNFDGELYTNQFLVSM